MLNIHYKRTTGEIIGYGGGFHQNKELATLSMPDDTNIWSNGQINKKVRLSDETLVPLPPTLLNSVQRADRLAEIASQTPQGNFVELGVYKGGTAWRLLEVANRQGRELHLFDTFTGIPYKGEYDLNEVGDFADVNIQEVKDLLPEAIFHIGLFPDTLGDDVKNIAFIHCDMDTYIATKTVKKALWERIVTGGMIYFDDIALKGIQKALCEDFPDYKYDSTMDMFYAIKGDSNV